MLQRNEEEDEDEEEVVELEEKNDGLGVMSWK